MNNPTSLAKFCSTNILDIPKGLLGIRDIKTLAAHEESSVFYKDLEADLVNIEFYTGAPCIVYIERGKEVITTSRDDSLEIGPNELIFLPKGLNLYSDYLHEGDGLNAFLLLFGQDVITRFLSTGLSPSTLISNEEAIIKIEASQAIKDYFNALPSICDFLNHSSHFLQIKLLEFLYLLDIHNKGELRRSLQAVQRGNPQRNIKRLMHQHAISDLSAKELAALSGRSISAFNRDFKRLFGTTPKQWLIERRISHAHYLLSTMQWSVTATAAEVGYSNISHFIAAFKKVYGKTPHQLKIES